MSTTITAWDDATGFQSFVGAGGLKEHMPDTNTDFLPVGLESLSVDSICGFDLYKDMPGRLRLFRRHNISISQKDIDNLKARGHGTLYVPASQKGKLHEHMVKQLPSLLRDETVPIDTKLEVLTEASVSILDQVLTDPTSKKNIRGSVDHCRNHVDLALQGDDARRAMMDVQPQTCFPIAHAISVGNLSILLGLRCGIEKPADLHELGVGATLHEIGKRLIDRDYYFRADSKARVTNSRLKKYPIVGTDMLRKMQMVPAGALRSILEHQERLDGSGFPQELKANDISLAARIVAICDYFDESMHAGPVHGTSRPFQILMEMRKASYKFDSRVLMEFIRLLGTDVATEQIRA